jgi:hypothetical protein
VVLEQGGRRTLPGAAAFWILAALFLMLFFASAAASPLYPVYQVKFGALVTSVLVQYAPAPTHLIWWALLAASAIGIPAALVLAEPGTRHPGALASLRSRIAVPRQARRTFAGAVPCLVAMALIFRGINPQTAMLAGCLLLLVGAGFGLGFQGAFRMITALATAGQRAGLVTAIFAVGYLAFSVPALIAGVTATRFGLHATALVYSASVAVLVLAATGVLLVRRRAVGGS